MTLVATATATATAPPAPMSDNCQPQRILVVDENELMQSGLRSVLADTTWVESCLVAGTAAEAWLIARRHHPQLVLVSTSLGGRTSIELCRALKERLPYVKVVLLSGEGRVSAASATAVGAVAAVTKHMSRSTIVAALKRVAEGAKVFPKQASCGISQLSKRESDVLQHLASGMSNPEVAAALNLSRHTVKQYTSAVYRKLGVRNRAEAASRAQELGLLH